MKKNCNQAISTPTLLAPDLEQAFGGGPVPILTRGNSV
jgi:hypothetical protein